MRAVMLRTGLSSHVLRAWETRYRAIAPERSAGGHRLYSDEDLDRLLLLQRHLHQGRRIGQIATLRTDQLRSLLASDPLIAGTTGAEAVRTSAARALDPLDPGELERVLGGGLLALGLAGFIDDVTLPLLGDLDGSRPEGRLLARTLESVLAGARAGLPRRAAVGRVVVASPVREAHEVCLQAVATIAAAEGADAVYLGAELPGTAMRDAAASAEARVVALAIPAGTGRRRGRAALETLREELPRGLALLVWNPGNGPELEEIRGVGVLTGQEDLRAFFRTFH